MNKDELKQQMIQWRHQLHSHPEAAFEEVETAAFVAEKLREMGIEVAVGIGKTGVVGTLKAGEGDGIIGLRADMDCICMQEQGDVPYKSRIPQRMHACGHDGHTVTLLGAAKLLSESKDFNGTVRFVFQPAEEPGKGALAMIEDGLFERFPVHEMYGLHNSPQFEEGQIAIGTGGVMASEDNFTIRIKGKGGHASAPELTKDPLVTAAEIVCALQTIVARNVSPADAAVISCTEFETDGVHNAIPSNVVIRGDTRSFKTEVSQLIEDRMRSICEHICEMNRMECEFTYTHEFLPTINWKENAAYALSAAKKVFGEENVFDQPERMMGSEDFARFIISTPGCYAFLGSRKQGEPVIPPHNALYDYNDETLLPGAEFFAQLVRERLPR